MDVKQFLNMRTFITKQKKSTKGKKIKEGKKKSLGWLVCFSSVLPSSTGKGPEGYTQIKKLV